LRRQRHTAPSAHQEQPDDGGTWQPNTGFRIVQMSVVLIQTEHPV
jgi:hypothetical protein